MQDASPRPPIGLRRLAGGMALALVFVTSVIASTLGHLPTPVGRAVLADGVNRLLKDVFFGTVRLEGVEHIGLRVVRVSGVSVLDERGDRLLHLADVRIFVTLPQLVGSLLLPTSGERVLTLPPLRAELAEVALTGDAEYGGVTLARALTPRPTPPKASSGRKTEPTTVLLPSIELGRVVGKFKLPVIEALQPELAAVQGSVQITEAGVAVDVKRFGIVVGGLAVPMHGTAAVQVNAPKSVDVQLSGFLGESELQASFAWREGAIETNVSSPRLLPTTVKSFVPNWPVVVPLALKARANGPVERLDVAATLEAVSPSQEASSTTSLVTVDGALEVGTGLTAMFTTNANDLSLDLLGEPWPASTLDATASTKLSYVDGLFEQRTTGKIPAANIASVPVPEVTLDVETAAHRTELSAVLHEPNARGELEAVHLASGDVDATLRVPRLYLAASRRVPTGIRGVASINAKGHLTSGGTLALDVDANVNNLAFGGLSVGKAHLSAKTQRALAEATQGAVAFTVDGSQIAYGQLQFGSLRGRANLSGATLRADVALDDDDGRKLEVSGKYDTNSREVSDLTVTARRSDLVGTAVIPFVSAEGPIVEVASLDIQRTGCTLDKCPHVTGSGRYAPGQLRAKIDARDVALERLWPVVGLVSPVHGLVNAKLDVQLGDGDHAELVLDARDVSVSGYPKTNLDVQAHLRDDHLEAEVAAQNALGIVVGGRASGTLAGPPLAAESWQGVVGVMELEGQLDSLEPLRLIANVPNLRSLDGTAHAKLTAQRLTTHGYPIVSAEVDVVRLGAEISREGGVAIVIADHRAYANATLDTEREVLYTSGLLEDTLGPVLRLNGQIPVETDGQLALATQAPLLVNGTLEPRDLGALPYIDLPVSGQLGGQLTVYGTVDAPEARVRLQLTELTAAALDDRRPLSVQASTHYALPSGALSAEVLGVSGNRSVILGRAEGTFVPSDPLFRGRARLALDAFPLGVVTPLAALELDGRVTGIVELADTPSPSADVQLEIDDFTSAGSSLGRGLLQAHAGLGRMNARFELEDAMQGADVVFEAAGDAKHLPTADHVETMHARIIARQLNAAVLSPLMSGLVARLSGELDSDVSLDWEKDPTTSNWRSRAAGLAHLRRGRAYVEGVGLELQDVTLDVVATPFDERTHIAIDRVQARARSETVNVEGRGQLLLSGASVESGSVNALFRDVPLTLQGLNLGTASGAASAQLERKESWEQPGPYFGKPYVLVNATLGNWRLRASSSASRSLIDTTPHSEIVVVQGQRLEERREVVPYRIVLDLGRDTQFSLAELDIPLSGETRIDYTDRAVVSGTLKLERGGRVPILGHVFEVQSGTLRLNPALPSNPSIDILLAGQAKDGTPVNVTITGTMQAPIVNPPLGQLSELLGGGAATALSGGVQALGLNSLLGDSVQFRVGSDDNNQDLARYSAAVQIRDSLWFEVNYARTETNAFRTDNNNAISGTLDYRFDDNWSLRTEAGTTGGSVDVVWQYRY